MCKKLSQLNIHVPWLQGSHRLLGWAFFVHKCSENGMIKEGWQEFLTYKYRSSQWIRSDAYILSSSFILSIYTYTWYIYCTYLLESSRIHLCHFPWFHPPVSKDSFHPPSLWKIPLKTWTHHSKAKLKFRFGDCDDLLLLISTSLTNKPNDFLKWIPIKGSDV